MNFSFLKFYSIIFSWKRHVIIQMDEILCKIGHFYNGRHWKYLVQSWYIADTEKFYENCAEGDSYTILSGILGRF